MNMKTRGLFLTLAAMAAMEPMDSIGIEKPVEVNAGSDLNRESYYLKKGMRRFDIGGEKIWARDEKNAIRKARNKGLLI